MFRGSLLLLALAAAAGLIGPPAAAASREEPGIEYTSGPTLSEAQWILQQLGYLQAGSYRRGEDDEATAEAVTRFQRSHALRPTGRVDAETLTQILQHRPASAGGPLVLKGVRFEPGSATLDPDSLAVLDGVARSLKANPHVRVTIAGHTDSTGTATRNDRLSKARADAVREYLVDKGVSGSRLEARGYGARRPVADNDTWTGRAENRRVELTREG
jgi:outer membrane protein OmpA-like peptidoglycan-associated protein